MHIISWIKAKMALFMELYPPDVKKFTTYFNFFWKITYLLPILAWKSFNLNLPIGRNFFTYSGFFTHDNTRNNWDHTFIWQILTLLINFYRCFLNFLSTMHIIYFTISSIEIIPKNLECDPNAMSRHRRSFTRACRLGAA